jgi:peroxin-6
MSARRNPTITPHVLLKPSPFGDNTPPIPVARTVTVARVASPISVDRTYQPLCLRALKDYFESKKRLVKQGDLIAVAIRTDDVKWMDNFSELEADASHGTEAGLYP